MQSATVGELEEKIARLRGLKRGESMVYYSGFLAADRERNVFADHIGDEAWNLYRAGRATLTQQRWATPNNIFSYIAIAL